ncbi:MAG: hypothetical protein PVG35_21655 [Desulfobacterales bacterium]
MKFYLRMILIFFFVLVLCADTIFINDIYANPPDTETKTIQELEKKVNIIDQALSEVRKGQINYSIEKNLLKEAYSSNLSTINIVITITLGLIAVIGFLGVKSIYSVRKEFKKELETLIQLKDKQKEAFLEITRQQKLAEEEFNKIREVYEEHNRRLKILELQEKAKALIKAENYKRALEHIMDGLCEAPNDDILLREKVVCCSNLLDYNGAVECNEKLLEINDNQIKDVANLAELYMLNNNIEKYEELIKKNKQTITNYRAPFLMWYFELIRIYIQDDAKNLMKHVNDNIPMLLEVKLDTEKEWAFREITTKLKSDPESPKKAILLNTINFLQGKFDEINLKESFEQLSQGGGPH